MNRDLITDQTAQLVTPAYAIETGAFTLAPWQTITAEGIKLNTPPGKELEDPNIYNGKGRIFGPDGQNLVDHPHKDFQGLLLVDVSFWTCFWFLTFPIILQIFDVNLFLKIDLDEIHLTKSLADFVSCFQTQHVL